MSSISPVGRSEAALKNRRVSLCSFTFADGRRCRTPRTGNHPHFCFCHAQKEARARATEKLGKDLAYFFSGDYLSACDLSTALGRLIPAVVRGDVKPRTARTVAYLAQTLMQAIHISQHEYINAFDTNGWRKSIRNSVNDNHDYLFPPDPKPAQSPSPQPQPPSPRNPMPPTSAAFVQQVVAGLQTGAVQAPQPAPPQTQPQQPTSAHPSNLPRPVETPVNCHSERSEEPAFPLSSAPSPTSPPASQTSASTTAATHPIPATQPVRSVAPIAQPNNSLPTRPSTPQPAPNRDPYALHFDHNCRLRIDGQPF